ncbi:MAG: hypothetical protein ACLT8V_01100 [Streptococcus salivarius]
MAMLTTLKKAVLCHDWWRDSYYQYPRREVYQAIHNLSTKYNVPIVGEKSGMRRGYFIAETKEELLNGLKPLESQVRREQNGLPL